MTERELERQARHRLAVLPAVTTTSGSHASNPNMHVMALGGNLSPAADPSICVVPLVHTGVPCARPGHT